MSEKFKGRYRNLCRSDFCKKNVSLGGVLGYHGAFAYPLCNALQTRQFVQEDPILCWHLRPQQSLYGGKRTNTTVGITSLMRWHGSLDYIVSSRWCSSSGELLVLAGMHDICPSFPENRARTHTVVEYSRRRIPWRPRSSFSSCQPYTFALFHVTHRGKNLDPSKSGLFMLISTVHFLLDRNRF